MTEQQKILEELRSKYDLTPVTTWTGTERQLNNLRRQYILANIIYFDGVAAIEEDSGFPSQLKSPTGMLSSLKYMLDGVTDADSQDGDIEDAPQIIRICKNVISKYSHYVK